MTVLTNHGARFFFKQDSGPRTEMITGAALPREMPGEAIKNPLGLRGGADG